MGFTGSNITGCNSPSVGNDKTTFAGVWDASMQALDNHQHTNGKGLPIPLGGLAAGAVDETAIVATTFDATMTGGGGTKVGVAAASLMPTGIALPYAGSSAPTGWLICDGSAVSRTTYAALFAILATTFGSGNGTTTFNVPDLRGRIPVGKDNMGGSAASRMTTAGSGVDGLTLGASGGEQTHVLTPAELANHNHQVNDPSHTHTVTNPTGQYWKNDSGNPQFAAAATFGATSTALSTVVNNSSTGITLGTAGSDTAHNNTQPSIIMNYIIKA